MPLFNFTPQQSYTRTPAVNQTAINYNTVNRNAINPNYGSSYNIASLPTGGYGYGASSLPGTTAYRLPAQNYYNYGVNNPSFNGTQSLGSGLISTAINSGIRGFVNGLLGNNNRLYGTNVAAGAVPQNLLQPSNGASNTAFNEDDGEDRVLISDNTGYFIGRSSVFTPLEAIGGVLFPYTPQIQVTHKASYEMQNLVHTNYTTPAYQYSSVENIGIQAQFTANYPAEAEYVVAMLHFFRSVTKMFYGQDFLAGTPPPVLFLDGYGPYTFDHIPVVVTSFDYSLPTDVDYISCTVDGIKQKVPTSLSINLSLVPTYSRNKISTEFGLLPFSQGALITGTNTGPKGSGGYI